MTDGPSAALPQPHEAVRFRQAKVVAHLLFPSQCDGPEGPRREDELAPQVLAVPGLLPHLAWLARASWGEFDDDERERLLTMERRGAPIEARLMFINAPIPQEAFSDVSIPSGALGRAEIFRQFTQSTAHPLAVDSVLPDAMTTPGWKLALGAVIGGVVPYVATASGREEIKALAESYEIPLSMVGLGAIGADIVTVITLDEKSRLLAQADPRRAEPVPFGYTPAPSTGPSSVPLSAGARVLLAFLDAAAQQLVLRQPEQWPHVLASIEIPRTAYVLAALAERRDAAYDLDRALGWKRSAAYVLESAVRPGANLGRRVGARLARHESASAPDTPPRSSGPGRRWR